MPQTSVFSETEDEGTEVTYNVNIGKINNPNSELSKSTKYNEKQEKIISY